MVSKRKGRASATVRVVLATLSVLFVFAKASYQRWATVNPCEGIELPAAAAGVPLRILREWVGHRDITTTQPTPTTRTGDPELAAVS